MTMLMTITAKGQVTFPKKLLLALGLGVGDRLVAKLDKGKVVVRPAGRDILDLAGTFGKLIIPKGKTIDDLINEATLGQAGHAFPGY